MTQQIFRRMATTASIISAIVLTACTVPGGTTGPIGSTGPAANAGTVQMWVTDAPRSDNVSEIWVTVGQVTIHKADTGDVSDNASGNVSGNTSGNVTGNLSEGQEDTAPENEGDWITINITGADRFDLLTLRGDGNGSGIQQILATANLAAGRYTQIRMTVSKVEVKINGVLKDATVPSGKIRFVHPFVVQAGNMTKLLFDFDADKFVTVTGNPNSPKILVKPVIKLTASRPEKGQPENEGVDITTAGLPNGSVNTTYSVNLSARGGTLPYTWTLQGSGLPDGLTLSPAGVISGTANKTGNFGFTIRVSDNSTPSGSDTQHYTIQIN